MTDFERTTTRRTVVRPGADPAEPTASVSTTDTAYVGSGPDGVTITARIITFAFGILQVLLILRIILLLLIANHGNDIVGFVLAVTQPFVEPFLGMFSLDRVATDQGSVLDVAALVALIGWTLIEALILAALRIFSRQPSRAV
jgi:hypothetical protein